MEILIDIKNFRINNPICTDTASYLIGDKDSIDKERNKGKIDEYGLTKYIIGDWDKGSSWSYSDVSYVTLILLISFFIIEYKTLF